MGAQKFDRCQLYSLKFFMDSMLGFKERAAAKDGVPCCFENDNLND